MVSENHDKIKRVQEKPIVLKWLSDPTDLSDPLSKEKNAEKQITKEEQNESKLMSVKSDRPDREEDEEHLTDDDLKLLNISGGNRKHQPIEMTKEEYDSWMGRNESEREEYGEDKEMKE